MLLGYFIQRLHYPPLLITIVSEILIIFVFTILITVVFAKMIREGVKKNWEKAVRLTALGGMGGSPPSSLTETICENFRTFFQLNMIP